jgi:AraC-like DNA-binding protein
MVDALFLTQANLLLRGGVAMLLLVVAALMARDHGRIVAGKLGAAFALGVAAYAICSCAGLHEGVGLWAAPILALSVGNNLVFWLFARSLFDDRFVPKAWHGALWAAFAALGLTLGFVLEPSHSPLTRPVEIVLTLSPMVFAVLAAVQTVASWRADLVERRRRLRLFIVVACAGYITFNTLANVLGAAAAAPLVANTVQALSLAVIAGTVAWSLLGVAGGQALFPAPASDQPVRPLAEDTALDGADLALVAALERAMTFDRLYRQEGLTIGGLAQRQGLAEYRLRRLINQGLGHRNFNAFLNGYRIAEAKAALADPSQAEVPILTIALDTGFNSLGPFNRAFKAETGLTPTAYRQRADGEGEPQAAEVFRSTSAGRIPNSA